MKKSRTFLEGHGKIDWKSRREVNKMIEKIDLFSALAVHFFRRESSKDPKIFLYYDLAITLRYHSNKESFFPQLVILHLV